MVPLKSAMIDLQHFLGSQIQVIGGFVQQGAGWHPAIDRQASASRPRSHRRKDTLTCLENIILGEEELGQIIAHLGWQQGAVPQRRSLPSMSSPSAGPSCAWAK